MAAEVEQIKKEIAERREILELDIRRLEARLSSVMLLSFMFLTMAFGIGLMLSLRMYRK